MVEQKKLVVEPGGTRCVGVLVGFESLFPDFNHVQVDGLAKLNTRDGLIGVLNQSRNDSIWLPPGNGKVNELFFFL